MKEVVFYSWQSDLPNSTNRGFIQKALENAVKTIASDDSVTVEPVVDRDTQGIPGAPDIASTIFAKIKESDVFVADISIISNPKKGRPTPNPNVLIELGYALRGLGHKRVILAFNQSFGEIEGLPFDLRMRRLTVYKMPPKKNDRVPERLKLEKQLEQAVRSALDVVSSQKQKTSLVPAIDAIETRASNKIIVLRRDLKKILEEIDSFQPKKPSEGGDVNDLISSIDSTQETIVKFSQIVEATSVMRDQESALEIYKWFGNILERYNYPQNTPGKTSIADHDYFKFVGHEMLVMFVAFFIKEEQWNILKTFLNQQIPIQYVKWENGSGIVDWSYASDHLPLLIDESSNKKKISIQADILNARHTSGRLSQIIPMNEFIATDFFLFLLGELPSTEYNGGFFHWRPWSVLYMSQIPAFIKKAKYRRYATQLTKIFNAPGVDEFKKRLKERHLVVGELFTRGFWHTRITDESIDQIGTE